MHQLMQWLDCYAEPLVRIRLNDLLLTTQITCSWTSFNQNVDKKVAACI
jgi:hypothetical protein